MIPIRLLVPVVIVLGLGSPVGQASIDARVARQIETEAAEFIAVRRDLHRHPEVSGREVRTAGIVAARLTALGLSVRTGVGGHGVVGLLAGGRPGPIVAFRADMDAFPSRDPDPVDFASETPGVRHICGHDVHVAVGLALASAFASVRADLPGSVLFIFQPAEENATGARAMLKEAALGTPTPAAIYALHASPYEAGQIATRPGVLMPARDVVRVSATGSGDVGRAMAEARALLATLSTITPAEALQPAADGFAFVQMGAPAPAAGALVMQGTITVAGAAARDRVKQALARGLGAIAVPDVSLTHQYVDRYIAGATNDADLTAAAMARLTAVFGAAAAPAVQGILPAFSEDFGSFQDAVPGVFFFLGVGNAPKGIVGMPHAPAFVVDETAIAFGARAMAAVLLDRLSRPVAPGQASPVRSGRTKTGIAYDVRGSGPAVVLISGSNLDRRLWNSEADWLALGRTVVRYDLRAHGSSDTATTPFSHVDDLFSVLDDLGITTATLIGLSAGSTIALDAALRAPARVDRLVLVSPSISGHVPQARPAFTADLVEALRQRDYAKVSDVLLASPVFSAPAASRALVSQMVRENTRLWTVPRELMTAPPPAVDRLGDVRVPALVLLGGEDVLQREAAHLLAAKMPRARLVEIPGGGHLLNLTSPEEFRAEVRRFIQGAPTQARPRALTGR